MSKEGIFLEEIQAILFPLFVFNTINAPLAGHFFCKSVSVYTKGV